MKWLIGAFMALAAFSANAQDETAIIGKVYVKPMQVCDTLEQVMEVVRANLDGGFLAGKAVFDRYRRTWNKEKGEFACGRFSPTPFVILNVRMADDGFDVGGGNLKKFAVVEVLLRDGSRYFSVALLPDLKGEEEI